MLRPPGEQMRNEGAPNHMNYSMLQRAGLDREPLVGGACLYDPLCRKAGRFREALVVALHKVMAASSSCREALVLVGRLGWIRHHLPEFLGPASQFLEVLGARDLGNLALLSPLVDLDFQFPDLGAQAILARLHLGRHALEGARELPQRVVPFGNGCQFVRFELVRLYCRRGVDHMTDLLEVLEFEISKSLTCKGRTQASAEYRRVEWLR